MRQLLILIFTFCTIQSFAQINVSEVSGIIQHNYKGIESASVSLIKVKDSSVVKTVSSNNEGRFIMTNVAAGNYILTITSVGFSKYYSNVFTLSDVKPKMPFKQIELTAAPKLLETVNVVAKKALVEQKLDKTVINVDASPTNVGITAMDVLEKSPGISVDKDGNISLKGKAGVMVMVDGKPTYLSSQDLANMLKAMPSSQLDQIEIMTNPPAKFDASGNSGVINIKTKKSKAKGFDGSVTLGAGMGIKPKSNISLNLNYRTGKFNFFTNYSYNFNKNLQYLNLNRKFRDKQTNQVLSVFDQYSHFNRTWQNNSGKIGLDYYLNKKTTLGLVVTGFYNPSTNENQNVTYINDPSGILVSRTNASSLIKEQWKNIGTNFNLRHAFDSAGRELTIDVDYVNYNRNSDQNFDNYFYDRTGAKKQPDESVSGYLPSNIDIYSVKADYTLPLKKNNKVEAGLKSSYVETDNNAQYANKLGQGDWIPDLGRSNHFVYKENINAAYINGTAQFTKKWSGQLGLRLENTTATGNQLTTQQKFNRDYTQLFPTAYVGYNMNDKNAFSLSYGRRINRPNYQDLNPFYYFIDKYTYEVGNPYLRPQFSHNIDLNHSFNSFLNSSINYSTTKDIFQQILEQVDSTNTTFLTRNNIAKSRSFGLSVSANMPLTKWWRTNIYTNIVNNHYEGLVNGGNLSVNGNQFMANISNQFTFKKGWSAEVSGFYRGKAIEGTMVSLSMGALNLGAGKQLFKNKGTLRLNVRDVLDVQKFRGYTRYQNIDMTIQNEWDNRVVNLSFTYRFGKAMQSNQQRKKGGINEEQSRINAGGNN